MLSLVGVLIVIVGFAIKLEPITIIMVSMIATAICGQIGFNDFLTIIGTNFMNTSNILASLFILILTGALERNGLKVAAANLIKKLKKCTAGMVLAGYTFIKHILIAFHVPFGGQPSFVRPILIPLAEGTTLAKEGYIDPKYDENMKCLAASTENFANFFAQLLFVGNAGPVLIQSTLAAIGVEIALNDVVQVQFPITICSIIVSCTYMYFASNYYYKKFYKNPSTKEVK